jgi:hypothetical protein
MDAYCIDKSVCEAYWSTQDIIITALLASLWFCYSLYYS